MKNTENTCPRSGLWQKYRIPVMTLLMYTALFGSNFLQSYWHDTRDISYDVRSLALKSLGLQYLLAAVTAVFLFYIFRRPPASRGLRLLEFLVFLVPGVILCTPTFQFLFFPGYRSFIGIWDPSITLHDSVFVYLGGTIIASGIIRFIKIKPVGFTEG